eukprot:9194628-Pyramimonas_sp.AAC.1
MCACRCRGALACTDAHSGMRNAELAQMATRVPPRSATRRAARPLALLMRRGDPVDNPPEDDANAQH